MYMHVSLCQYLYMCVLGGHPQRSSEVMGSSGAGVTRDCELPDMSDRK